MAGQSVAFCTVRGLRTAPPVAVAFLALSIGVLVAFGFGQSRAEAADMTDAKLAFHDPMKCNLLFLKKVSTKSFSFFMGEVPPAVPWSFLFETLG